MRTVCTLAAVGLVVAACGDDDDDSTADTADTGDSVEAPAPDETAAGDDTTATEPESGEPGTASTGSAGAASGWTVSTDDCTDPDAANAVIEGPVVIGASVPLSGGPVVSAFQPVLAGYQAYIDYANEQGLLEGHEIELQFADDQYDPALTVNAINGLLDGGADLISGAIGTANNLVVRDLLNEECVPHLLVVSGAPDFGEVTDYPWTTGVLTSYATEAAAYASAIADLYPDGATVATFYVNSELGLAYRDAFTEQAEQLDLEIVSEQTIDQGDSAPPTAQLAQIAAEEPDAIFAVPVGGNCPVFLNELANAKAATPDWEPALFLTATCASQQILASAGEYADGLYTAASGGLLDVESATDVPGVATFIDTMAASGTPDPAGGDAAGWTIGEVTVEILREAASSPDGLTRASIMNATRDLDYAPSLAREGVRYKLSGEEDGFLAEAIQIVQYDAATATFEDVGELNLEFESS